MKIARFSDATGRVQYGLVHGEHIHPIEETPAAAGDDWLALGCAAIDAIAQLAPPTRVIPIAAVKLLAPIARPRKFLGLGGNYSSHLQEIEHLGIKAPDHQVWFNKQSSCVTGPFEDVAIPARSNQTDYEGELAVVIGRRCRYVPAARAGEVIAGYMVCNDVSVRDVQRASPTITLGKSFDTHGPIGPWLVNADEIADPQQLRIRTWVNDELRQDGNTAEMRYTVFEQIAELSSVFTLEPGDILATGTPAGVAAAMRRPRFLQAGDVVRIEIERIGRIENRFVAERAGMQT
jgi:2-keto-4-pentenoate hydratase/2-oxohepta-3-ene-1,7-dioic acid hydratase in catechol pathway